MNFLSFLIVKAISFFQSTLVCFYEQRWPSWSQWLRKYTYSYLCGLISTMKIQDSSFSWERSRTWMLVDHDDIWQWLKQQQRVAMTPQIITFAIMNDFVQLFLHILTPHYFRCSDDIPISRFHYVRLKDLLEGGGKKMWRWHLRVAKNLEFRQGDAASFGRLR